MARKYPTTRMCNGELLERFEPTVRDTDVFTATIAKCGQTWLTALLHHLRTKGHDPEFGGKTLLGVVPWLEIPWHHDTMATFDTDARLQDIESLPDPRVFKMHVVWDEIPRPEGSKARILTVTRDPRDVPYSMYCHLQRLRIGPFSDGAPPFEQWFDSWLETGFYFKFVHSFWAHRTDPDVLWLRYEDMIEDIGREARRIVAFLEWDLSEADIDRAVPLTRFDHMRKTEATAVMPGPAFKEPFFREGGVGKNRSKLTPEMEQRIVERIRAEFTPECADFLLAQGG